MPKRIIRCLIPAVALKTSSVSVPQLVNVSVSKEGQLADVQLQEQVLMFYHLKTRRCVNTVLLQAS